MAIYKRIRSKKIIYLLLFFAIRTYPMQEAGSFADLFAYVKSIFTGSASDTKDTEKKDGAVSMGTESADKPAQDAKKDEPDKKGIKGFFQRIGSSKFMQWIKNHPIATAVIAGIAALAGWGLPKLFGSDQDTKQQGLEFIRHQAIQALVLDAQKQRAPAYLVTQYVQAAEESGIAQMPQEIRAELFDRIVDYDCSFGCINNREQKIKAAFDRLDIYLQELGLPPLDIPQEGQGTTEQLEQAPDVA